VTEGDKTGGGPGSNQHGPKARSTRPSKNAPVERVRQQIEGAGFVSAREARTAIHDHARLVAKQGRFNQAQARQQFFAGRLVDRVFVLDLDEQWILKGGLSALARNPMVRFSGEADMQSERNFDDANEDLLRAAEHDLGDQINYRHVSTRAYERHPGSGRLSFEATIGGTTETIVAVDVSTVPRLTAAIERVPAMSPLGIRGLAGPAEYLLYPTVDQVADKAAATYERTSGLSGDQPSTRYHDLLDLEIIARTRSIAGTELHVAVVTEFKARGLDLPETFDVPDRRAWGEAYERMAEAVPELRYQKIDDGLAVVKGLLDPILRGERPGRWNPEKLRWE